MSHFSGLEGKFLTALSKWQTLPDCSQMISWEIYHKRSHDSFKHDIKWIPNLIHQNIQSQAYSQQILNDWILDILNMCCKWYSGVKCVIHIKQCVGQETKSNTYNGDFLKLKYSWTAKELINSEVFYRRLESNIKLGTLEKEVITLCSQTI